MENYCVDPARPPYKGTVGARVLIDVVWLDDGHKRAFKEELIKLDEFDAEVLAKAGQIELLKKAA